MFSKLNKNNNTNIFTEQSSAYRSFSRIFKNDTQQSLLLPHHVYISLFLSLEQSDLYFYEIFILIKRIVM